MWLGPWPLGWLIGGGTPELGFRRGSWDGISSVDRAVTAGSSMVVKRLRFSAAQRAAAVFSEVRAVAAGSSVLWPI